MSLPKINHKLNETNLNITEKIDYIKARCLLSACLNAETGSLIYNKESEAISTLITLNNKIRGL